MPPGAAPEVRCAVLDWSGTLVDAYAIAPARALVRALARHGIGITMGQARRDMGLRKDLHVRSLLGTDEVRDSWRERHGALPGDEAAEAVHREFKAELLSLLGDHAALLPGVRDACRALREKGIAIGVTTGFDRETVDALLPLVEGQGFAPDCAVAGDDVANGTRPRPFMLYRALERMDVSPACAVVKVDDTPAGIGEGLSAGCWTVGVSAHSSLVGVDSLEQERAMPAADMEAGRSRARKVLGEAGAHFVVDGVADLPEVVDTLNTRIRQGERP